MVGLGEGRKMGRMMRRRKVKNEEMTGGRNSKKVSRRGNCALEKGTHSLWGLGRTFPREAFGGFCGAF
jgi:hypothetical protein